MESIKEEKHALRLETHLPVSKVFISTTGFRSGQEKRRRIKTGKLAKGCFFHSVVIHPPDSAIV